VAFKKNIKQHPRWIFQRGCLTEIFPFLISMNGKLVLRHQSWWKNHTLPPNLVEILRLAHQSWWKNPPPSHQTWWKFCASPTKSGGKIHTPPTIPGENSTDTWGANEIYR
jgi:hypothetical protein